MSIVVAVRKADRIAVAADTMHTSGSRREHPDNIAARSKLRRVGRSCIGGVGWTAYDNILDHYVRKQKRTPTFKDENAVFAFFLRFWQALRRDYQVVNDQPEREDRSPFADLDSEFIVVNRGGIYHVASDLSVMQFQKYVAIGAGDRYAYGALHALYDTRRTAEQIARQATEAAVHFDQACGGAIEIVRVE